MQFPNDLSTHPSQFRPWNAALETLIGSGGYNPVETIIKASHLYISIATPMTSQMMVCGISDL